MKRKIPILLFLLASYGLFGQDHSPISQSKELTDYKQKLDSLIVQNTFGSAFYKNFFTYDDQERLIEDVFIFVEMDGKTRTQYSYAETGELIANVSHSWDEGSGQWIPEEKTEYTYNGNGLIVYTIYSEWDVGASLWMEDTKTTYTYDGEGKLTAMIDHEWDSGTSDWMEDRKEEFFYYPDGYVDYQVDYDMLGSIWQKMWKHDYTYDAEQKLIIEIEFEWDNVADWDLTYKYEYTYDSNGNLVVETGSEWDEIENTWTYVDKNELEYDNAYTYDDLVLPVELIELAWRFNNMLTGSTYFSWEASGGTWNAFYEVGYYYSDYIPGYINEPELYHIALFPNPAGQVLNIVVQGISIDEVAIYSLTGQQVLLVRPRGEVIDISSLTAGIYIVEVTVENSKFRRKLLVE